MNFTVIWRPIAEGACALEILKIPLTKAQKAFVDAQAAAAGLDSAGEYVARLVREAELEKERDRIDALLLEAIENGQSTPMTPQDWKDIRERAKKRIAAHRRKRPRKKMQRQR